mgnify:CR=1 FL=1
MKDILQEIKDDYLDYDFNNDKLISALDGLNHTQLQVVLDHIENFGDCKLRRVTENPSDISVKTDHPDDLGVTYHHNTYRR